MCDKVVNTYPSTIKFVLKCPNFIPDKYNPDKYKTQRIFDSVISEDFSLILYCLDKYKTQKCVMKLLMIV